MHSIRTKMTMLAVFLTVVVVTVAAVLSVIFIRNKEQSESEQLLLMLRDTGGRNLDYYFTSVERSVRKVSMYAEKDLEGLETEQLERHVERIRVYFDEIANKTNGVLTFYYRIDPEISDTVQGFWYTNLDGDDFTEHEVTDITLYDTRDTTKLIWFTVPKHSGQPVWLSPYKTDNLDDVRVISYNMPIFFKGKFIGVIGIEIDNSTMAEQVASIRLYKTGYAFLNDANGNLIYHPFIDVASMPEDERPKAPEGMISNNTFVRYTYDGIEKKAAWMKLSNGMRLNVAVPVNETDGEWEQLIREIILVSAGVLIVLAAITLYATGKITKPLKQLTEAAKKVEKGNYDFTLDYSRDDEVGSLTRVFKRLTDNMKEHISELNRKAYVDSLTSVRNKGAYMTYLEELQKKTDDQSGEMEFAIGVFDCDDLKNINDRFGHEKGDIYLKTASRLICKVFQHSPVFRIGGDEFSVVLQNDDFRKREELIRLFMEKSEEICNTAQNEWEKVYVAVGVAVYDYRIDHAVINTVSRADKNMYADKKARKEKREERSV